MPVTNPNQYKNVEKSKTTKKVAGERGIFGRIVLRYGVLFIAIAIFLVFAFLEPRFISPRNLFKIIEQGSVIGLLALGLTMVVISGGFDISFASIATLVGIVSVYLLGRFDFNLYLVWIVCIALATGISLVNAVNIVNIGVPSFVATLGMKALLDGISLWITGGAVIYYAVMPAGFASIGRAMIGGLIPSPVIFFALGAIVLIIFLEYTYFGRHMYAVGGGIGAARYSGINIRKVKYWAFLVMGIITGISGLIIASTLGTGNPVMGEGYLFPAIIATFLGAIFLKEGLPNGFGTIVAAMLLAIIANGLIMVGLPLYVKEIIQGIILAICVAIISMLKSGGIPGVKI